MRKCLLAMLVMVGAGGVAAGCGGSRARPVAPAAHAVSDSGLSAAECGSLVDHIFETTFSESSPAAREAARESEQVRMSMARMRLLCDADMPRPVYQCFMSAATRAEVQACTRRFEPADTPPPRPTPRQGEYEA